MSGYVPKRFLPGNRVGVVVKGHIIKKKIKSYFFTSNPVPNSDDLHLILDDGTTVLVDNEFLRYSSWFTKYIRKINPDERNKKFKRGRNSGRKHD